MTSAPAINTTGAIRSTTNNSGFNRWEGRLFGALVLAAFFLYGIGSALVDEPIGVALVAINSVAVTIVGVIGFRLLRHHNPWVGAGYLATRIAEAVLLGGGVALYTFADRSDADITGYLLAMLALGIGSLPFWYVVGRGPWLSHRFALWGMAGYLALAAGAVIELTTGREVTYFFAAPGGLFEIAVGVHLLRRGFGTANLPSPNEHRSTKEMA
jgi:hypothetical protein